MVYWNGVSSAQHDIDIGMDMSAVTPGPCKSMLLHPLNNDCLRLPRFGTILFVSKSIHQL